MKVKSLLLFAAAILLCGCGQKDSLSTNSEESHCIEDVQTSELNTDACYTLASNTSAAITTTIVGVTTSQSITETTSIFEEPNDGKLVKIIDYIPDAYIDLRYATENNFTGTVLYDDPEAYLCYGTVKKLINVQNELKSKGYSILIWDAYRTPEAQQKLWDVYPDPNFVADPRKGLTSHSRGGTVDIAIVNIDGTAIDLPSAFDEFSSLADRNYYDVSKSAANNAKLLEETMYKYGFTGYSGEWWDYSDTTSYTIEPVDFKETCSSDEYLTDFLSSNNYDFSDISDFNQIIVVDSVGSSCKVAFYEKSDRYWNRIYNSNGVVGRNGTVSDKAEGDFCTPKGLYTLGFGFGTEMIDTEIEYRLIDNDCYWVDDPKSEFYNQWIKSSDIRWDSAEHLSDYPKSYHYALTINYNSNPIIPGAGSAIFLHCISGDYTAGCVAIPEADMLYLFKWLNADGASCIIIQ